mmetsp:Transcript_36078/g.84579  ORF Transcript_36078/g.84579 Transcript_36078/m.84579 type:complete len:362 (-) Transcript_36078:205-1290(-)
MQSTASAVRASMTPLRIKALFDSIHSADLEGVQTAAKGMNLRCNDTLSGATPLQAIVYQLAMSEKEEDSKALLEIAHWLVREGADPDQEGDDVVTNQTQGHWQGQIWMDEDAEASKITFTYTGQSALSLLTKMRRDMKDSGCEAWKPYLSVWPPLMRIFMEALHAAMGDSSEARSSVLDSVSDLWVALSNDKDSHDLVITAADGDITAHCCVLSMASPVVNAMLSSGMSEAASKQIKVDCPAQSVRFILDLLYSGSSCQSYSSGFGLPALDLAHRWELIGVVGMLQRAAITSLSSENFGATAEAAILKNLDKLKAACETFAYKNPDIKATTLPAIVSRWLGNQHPYCSREERAAKIRRVAY